VTGREFRHGNKASDIVRVKMGPHPARIRLDLDRASDSRDKGKSRAVNVRLVA